MQQGSEYLHSKNIEAIFMRFTCDLLRHRPNDPERWLCERLCMDYVQHPRTQIPIDGNDQSDGAVSSGYMPTAGLCPPSLSAAELFHSVVKSTSGSFSAIPSFKLLTAQQAGLLRSYLYAEVFHCNNIDGVDEERFTEFCIELDPEGSFCLAPKEFGTVFSLDECQTCMLGELFKGEEGMGTIAYAGECL
jgi:hypothetical protein